MQLDTIATGYMYVSGFGIELIPVALYFHHMGQVPKNSSQNALEPKKDAICTLWQIEDGLMALERLLYHPYMMKICRLVRHDPGHRTTFVRPVSIVEDFGRCASQ